MASKLTPAQIEQYYRVRLDPFKLHHCSGSNYRALCPIHGGYNPSVLWVDLNEGNFACFSCGAKGDSPYTFEQKLLSVELNRSPMHDEVSRALETIIGTPFVQRIHDDPIARAKGGNGWNRKQARDFYRYTDEIGRELFCVWRFVDREGNKITPADRPCPCAGNPDAECKLNCQNGRTWTTKGVRRVLYRLPEVIASSLVFVVEGEKNTNDLSRALSAYGKAKGGFPLTESQILDHVAVTTNPGGARAWKQQFGFGRYFVGKIVVKLGDNDGPGRQHDEDACKDIAQHALQTFTLALPVGEGEDISDYLENHTVDELLRLLPHRKEWEAPKPKDVLVVEGLAPKPLLVKLSELVTSTAGTQGDWLVPGLIERGTRGLVVAPPKTGKSLLFLELVLCLATRRSFLGAPAYHRHVKCAVISREDGPGMVYRRLMQLAKPRAITSIEMDKYLLVNTEQQSARFKIDRNEDMMAMAEWLKSEGVEFCVLDVLNRLHDGEENSSDSMTRVMQRFDDLARMASCQITVIHHTNKAGGVKGSTAIEGWADWIARLEQSADDEEVKTLFLRTKSSGAVVPRTIRYWQSPDQTESRLQVMTTRHMEAA